MASYLSALGWQDFARPSVSAPNALRYIYFSRELTIAKLPEYLRVDRAQLDAMVTDIDRVLLYPSNSVLCQPGTRIRGKGVSWIALDIQQTHMGNYGFASHTDVQLLNAHCMAL
jgi:hypothetical protein